METYLTYSNSYFHSSNNIDYLYINEKAAYDNGFAAGTLLVRSNNRIIQFFSKWYIKTVLWLIYKICKRYYRYIEVPRVYMDELKGYADATNIAIEILYVLNFSFDLMKKSGIYCSTFSFHGNHSFIGRNTDFHPLISAFILKKSNPLIVTLSSGKNNMFTHVSFPLFIGVLNGFNQNKISVNAHQIMHTTDRHKTTNLATPLIGRLLLEHASVLHDVERIIKQNIPCRALNLLVSSFYEGKDMILEIKPPMYNCLSPFSHYTCCTTHFLSKEMCTYHTQKNKASIMRLQSLQQALVGQKNITTAECIALLQDTSNGTRYRHSGCSIANKGTFQSFIFQLDTLSLFIATGDRTPISLSGKYQQVNVARDYLLQDLNVSILRNCEKPGQ